MKRKNFYIAVIFALLLVPALMFVCKKAVVPNSVVINFSDTMTFYDFPRPDSTWQLVEGDSITVPTSGVYSIMWSNDSVWIKPFK